MNEILGAPVMLALLLQTASAEPFNFSKVRDGLYYYGTNAPDQVWGPLFLMERGKPLNPFEVLSSRGAAALEGEGKTHPVRAYGVVGSCRVDRVALSVVRQLQSGLPVAHIAGMDGGGCRDIHESLMAHRLDPSNADVSNPFQTIQSYSGLPGQRPFWLFGAPGLLASPSNATIGRQAESLGGAPSPVHAFITRGHYVPLPVLEPYHHLIDLAHQRPHQKTRPVTLGKVWHVGRELALNESRYLALSDALRERLMPRYLPRLRQAAAVLGPVRNTEFELALVYGLDLDDTRGHDYVGVARISLWTQSGLRRSVEVAWVWRQREDPQGERIMVLRSSEPELYAPANGYFRPGTPLDDSPLLTLPAARDFDDDGRMELLTSLVRRVGVALEAEHENWSEEIWTRDAVLHAWDGQQTWQAVYRLPPHELPTEKAHRLKARFIPISQD